jgi:hypothetical protein
MIAPPIIESARAVPIEEEIAKRGIRLKGRIDQSGPCPVCGGHDRFAINVRKQCFICRGCGIAGDVIKLVQFIDGIGFAEAVELLTGEETRPQAHPPASASKQSAAKYKREQHRKAAWLWSRRQPISGSIAARYLRENRKITCPLPATLGYLPPQKPEHHPAMIACFGLCEEPEPGLIIPPRNVQAVHLTLLDGNGKADVEPNKIIIGSPGNLPLVIAPPHDLLALAVCEGVEDALTAHQATGLGAWAAGSAPFMSALAETVPDSIEAITIYAHRDEAGKHGAQQLAQALDQRGIEVFIEGLP